MLSRRCSTLFRTRMVCTTIFTNDSMSTSNLHRNCVAYSYCITNARVHNFKLNTRSLSSTVDENVNKDHRAKLVNQTIHRNNDVSKNLLTSIIDDFEKNDSDILETSSLMLLHSCGSALQSEPLEIRQELVNRVWDLLKKGKCKLTISHYHALLQAYIDNDQIVDQNQFLEDMTVTPEHDTYSLLLRVPGTNNSEFADSILSKLEQNSLPIDHEICDSLMYAYATSGNVEKIMETAQLMKKKNVERSTLLKTYLMQAYARKGNIEELIDALRNTVLSVPHIIMLVKHISLSNNGMYIPTILSHIQSLTVKTIKRDLMNTVAQLVHADHVLDAYEIVTHVPVNEELEDARKTLLLQFLEIVMKANKDRDIVKNGRRSRMVVVDRMEEEYFYSDIWNKVIESAVEHSGEAVAFKILDEMKAMGVTLKVEHFHPLFLYIQKQGVKDDVSPIIKQMQALDIKIDSETFLNYVLPCIDVSNPVAAVVKWRALSTATGIIVEPFARYLIDTGRLADCITICTMFKTKIDCQPVLDSLYQYYKKTNDIGMCIQFLFLFTNNGRGFVASFIKKLLTNPNKSEIVDDLQKFLIASKHYEASISIIDAQNMVDQISNSNLIEVDKRRILGFISNIKQQINDNCNVGKRIHPLFMNMTQLRTHFEELKAKSKNPRGALRKLFIAACHHNKEELVNQLIEEMDKYKFNWTAGMRLSLFDHYIKTERIEEALYELNVTQSKFKDFKIDNFKILRCAILLVKLGRLDDAVDVINKCTSVNHRPEVHSLMNTLFSLTMRNSPDQTSEIANCLVRREYCKDTYVLRYLILSQILKGNIERAVTLFTQCVERYKRTPARLEILVELMKLSSNPSARSDCDFQVKKVYGFIKELHGKYVADINLLIAFALCNKIPELRDLLKTGDIKENLLVDKFEYLKDDDVMKCILTIMDVVDNESKISTEFLCNATLSMWDKRGAREHFIELARRMKEMNIKSLPSSFTKQRLRNIY